MEQKKVIVFENDQVLITTHSFAEPLSADRIRWEIEKVISAFNPEKYRISTVFDRIKSIFGWSDSVDRCHLQVVYYDNTLMILCVTNGNYDIGSMSEGVTKYLKETVAMITVERDYIIYL